MGSISNWPLEVPHAPLTAPVPPGPPAVPPIVLGGPARVALELVPNRPLVSPNARKNIYGTVRVIVTVMVVLLFEKVGAAISAVVIPLLAAKSLAFCVAVTVSLGR